jgi:hypothetical protein
VRVSAWSTTRSVDTGLTSAPEDGRSPIASYDNARRRDAIFDFLARFTVRQPPPTAVFNAMAESVYALSGTQPWTPAMAPVDRPAISGRGDETRSASNRLEQPRSML